MGQTENMMRRGEKTVKIIYAAFFLIAALLAGYACYSRAWSHLGMVMIALVCLVTPHIAAWMFRVRLTPTLEGATVVFLFCTGILGEVLGFYGRITVWDDLLHLTSGGLFCAFGFGLFTGKEELLTRGNYPARAFHAGSFALAAGALWELFEYTLDSTLGTNMQKDTLLETHFDPGLTDTMSDLACGLVGLLIFLIWAYWQVAYGRGNAQALIPGQRSKEEPVI